MKKYKGNIFLMVFLLLAPMIAIAGEYAGLTPGVSTKQEVEKEFGQPIKEYKQKHKYGYSPEGHDVKFLSARYYDDGTLRSINLGFQKPYEASQIREWFDLGRFDNVQEINGHRVEVYRDKSIKIIFEGTNKADKIIQLTHLDLSERNRKASLGSCPADAEKYAQQADPFIEKDQYAKAITPLKKAAMCDSNKVIYSSMLAFSYWKTNQLNEAVEWAKKTLNIEEDYIAYCVLGSSYWEKKDCDSAVPYLEKAVSFSQDKGNDNLELLGACYYTQGKLNEAVDTLSKSNKRERRSPLTMYFLAASFDRLGQKANARSFYKLYLKTRYDNYEMNSLAKQRISELSKELGSSTREKTSQATQMIIKNIFGNN